MNPVKYTYTSVSSYRISLYYREFPHLENDIPISTRTSESDSEWISKIQKCLNLKRGREFKSSEDWEMLKHMAYQFAGEIQKDMDPQIGQMINMFLPKVLEGIEDSLTEITPVMGIILATTVEMRKAYQMKENGLIVDV